MPLSSISLLEGVRVLELSSRVSGAYCGRLLADMGAHVTRAAYPWSAHVHPSARRALERSLHGGKSDITAATAPLAVHNADIVIVDALDDDAFDRDVCAAVRVAVAERDPRTLITDLSDFGGSGVGAGWSGSPLVASAWATASWSIGDPAREPLSLPYDLPDYFAGVEGAAASLLALLLRDADAHTGEATSIASADVLAYYAGMMVSNFLPYGRPWHRDGARASQSAGYYPCAIFPCKDGAIGLTCRQPREWAGLLAAVGNPAWSQDPRFADARVVARDHADEVDSHLIPWTQERTVAEVFALGQEHGFPASPVRTVGESLSDAQFASRDFFLALEGEGPDEPTLRHPGPPYQLIDAATPAPAPTPGALPANADAPLAGMRVLDFTWVWSGPTVTAGLADLGAQVIKIEHTGHLDPARVRGRGVGDAAADGPDVDVAPYFNQLNRGKQSLTVDITTSEGVALIERLAAECDVVVESMRPGALGRRGLDFEALSKINPRLVMLSMAVVGQKGPLSHIKGYAMVMAGLSGADALVAYESDRPMGLFNMALGDVNAAGHALAVLLGAIVRQRRTGRGCHIDLSQTECMVAVLRAPLLESQVVPGLPSPANGHSDFDPHGHVRCAGDDDWLAIAVRTDAERRRVALVVGLNPCDDIDRDDLRTALERWALLRSADDATVELRAVAVPVAPVQSWERLVETAWAVERPTRVTTVHPLLGERQVVYLPWSVSGHRPAPTAGAPLLGEHTDLILQEVLGLPEAEIARLRDAGALSDPDAVTGSRTTTPTT